MARHPNDEKLRELIVYIANKTKKDPKCGAVKFNKLLFYSDFTAHRKLGHPITGAEYQHLEEGPAPRRFVLARKTLIEEGSIEIKPHPSTIGQPLQQIVPKRPAHSIFGKEELAIVKDVIKEFWDFTGTELSDLSHKEFGWRLTKEGEIIHYRTAWLSSEPLTLDQIELGKKIAEKYGLAV